MRTIRGHGGPLAGRQRGDREGHKHQPERSYGHRMPTESIPSGAHPQRQAAIAAHVLREALSGAGLLGAFAACRGVVSDSKATVELGPVEATAALRLAKIVRAGQRVVARSEAKR